MNLVRVVQQKVDHHHDWTVGPEMELVQANQPEWVRWIVRNRHTLVPGIGSHDARVRETLYSLGRWTGVRNSLQRLGFWIARKAGAREVRHRIDCGYQYSTVDVDQVYRFVLESQYNMELIYNRKAHYIVCGHDMFDKMQCEFYDFMRLPAFESDISIVNARNGDSKPHRFCGLEILVVPWIEGCFLLPALD